MNRFLILAAAFAVLPTAAFAQDSAPQEVAAPSADFDGVRVEARVGYETPTVSEDGDVYKIDSAVSYGGEAGFDIAAGDNVVVGPYAVYEFSSVKLCDGGFCLEENGNLGAGVRLGYAATPTVLLYGKLGYASISFKASAFGLSDSESKGGVQGALGVDVNLNKNVYAGVEFNYADYGKFEGINLQRRHVAAVLGFRY